MRKIKTNLKSKNYRLKNPRMGKFKKYDLRFENYMSKNLKMRKIEKPT